MGRCLLLTGDHGHESNVARPGKSEQNVGQGTVLERDGSPNESQHSTYVLNDILNDVLNYDDHFGPNVVPMRRNLDIFNDGSLRL